MVPQPDIQAPRNGYSPPPVGGREARNLRLLRWRKFTWQLVQSPTIDSKLEQTVRTVITVLIVLNVLAVMAETVENLHEQYFLIFHWLEIVSVIIFSIEYVLRVWSIVEEPKFSRPVVGRIRYAISFFALVDLLAILPFYLPMFTRLDLRTLRILRLLRLTRLMKLGRYSKAAQIMARILRNQREQLVMSLVVLLFLLICASTIIYYLEHDAQPEAFSSIPSSLWWGIVTLTTIGYGDVYPITMAGKICAAVILVLGIGMVALPSGIIVSGFVNEMEQERENARLKGIIICPHCGEQIGGKVEEPISQNTIDG